jgi:hypothetical protein
VFIRIPLGPTPAVHDHPPRHLEVEFITIILWNSLDDVRAIAGEDYEHAVIPEDRLLLLTRYDARAAHYEVVSTTEPAAR